MSVASIDKFVRTMERAQANAQQTPKQMVTTVAKGYSTAIKAETAAVAPSGVLRGVGKRGANIGIRTTITASAAQAKAVVAATGPYQLIEFDTKKHAIPRQTASRKTRSGRRPRPTGAGGRPLLVINGSVITGPVTHPGTKGKHPFQKGANKAERQVAADAAADLVNSLGRIFR